MHEALVQSPAPKQKQKQKNPQKQSKTKILFFWESTCILGEEIEKKIKKQNICGNDKSEEEKEEEGR